MRFYLLVEGYTEKAGVGHFLKRWLDARLESPVSIRAIRHDGWGQLDRDMEPKVKLLLSTGANQDKVAGVLALMDLYGPTIYPENKKTAKQRYEWGRDHFEKRINDPRFRMFFAVHEIEAWLLSDPSLFPSDVRKALPAKISKPEEVNFNEPPAKLLDRIYKKSAHGKNAYNKVGDGTAMFAKLNPEVAYEKCPYLKLMLDEMLELAKAAGN